LNTYLPDAAWKELWPQRRKGHWPQKKVTAFRRNKQFAANTPAAAKAHKQATRHKG
jgi:hypothetical protein